MSERRPEDDAVTLRDVQERDLPHFFDHQRDPEALRVAEFTPRNRDEFMAHWQKILDTEGVVTKTVLFGGHVAGNVVCFERGGRRQVGYWLGREFWGKGIATQALAMLLAAVGERPLFAFVARRNAGSIRVLEKNGFTRAGEHTEGEVKEFLYVLDP
jgi:RimJ/RimL family protein N-acetyltransferase